MTTPELTLKLHQIFTTVKAHLLTQRNQSVSSYGSCLYFDAATGRKCAVGCLIPPSLYDPRMEERVGLQDNRPVREALEAAGVIPKDCWGLAVPFLLRMQKIHDTFPVLLWASALDTMEQELFPHTQGHTMNNQKPLTFKDLQIPCDYGVYEYTSPTDGKKLPIRILGACGDCVVVVIKMQHGEVMSYHYDNSLGPSIGLIEQPKTTRQITYEDLVKLDWASYYYRSNLFKFTFLVAHVGTIHLTCSDAVERVFGYDELDGYLLPRPFAPESEWISTTVTE